MKNLKVTSCICLALLTLNSNIAFATTGIVNTPAVRIREKASTNSAVLTKAYEDEEVEIIAEEGNWYKVKVNDKTGYASKALIDKKNESTKSETENKVEENSVSTYKSEESTDNANSKTTIKEDVVGRILPNFGSNEAMLITKGTEVEVLKELNNWSEVFVSNTKVWILKNKISMSEEKPAVTVDDIETEGNTVIQENTVSENNTVVENSNTVSSVPDTSNTNINDNTTSVARNDKGIINVETANIRKKADKTSSIIYHLDEGDEVTIVAEEGDWYKITNSEVESGYVSKSLVTVSDVSSRGTQENREEAVFKEEVSSSKGEDVANFAKQYIGYNYVLGGKTPDTGFDCSGYTRYVFKNFGYSLGTVAANQNSLGTEIERENLKIGDLILFYNEEKTKIGHTGIYLGNNEFIHAANPDRGVVIDNLSTNSYYSTRFVTARRIVE